MSLTFLLGGGGLSFLHCQSGLVGTCVGGYMFVFIIEENKKGITNTQSPA